jgi:hypothetical protein
MTKNFNFSGFGVQLTKRQKILTPEKREEKERLNVCTRVPSIEPRSMISMITIFCDFIQFSAKKWRFSKKTMLR